MKYLIAFSLVVLLLSPMHSTASEASTGVESSAHTQLNKIRALQAQRKAQNAQRKIDAMTRAMAGRNISIEARRAMLIRQYMNR